MKELTRLTKSDLIPFEAFVGFERLKKVNPILACEPPEWAAAAHAMVVDDTVHYLWARRKQGNYWVLMHSTAPVGDPLAIKHDPRNPILLPSKEGFDDFTIELPFPVLEPCRPQILCLLSRQATKPSQADGPIGG